MVSVAKVQQLDSYTNYISKASLVLVFHYRSNDGESGLTVDEFRSLRRDIKCKGGKMVVVKNKILSLVYGDDSNQNVDLKSYFKGPTAVLCCYDDNIEPLQILVKQAKTLSKKISLKAAELNGKILSVADIKDLSALPSIDVLRGRLLSIISTPASRLLSNIQDPASSLCRVLHAYSSKVS